MIGARLQAAVTGIGSITLGCLYGIAPEELVRRPLQPGQVSAVLWIASFGPVWSILFVMSGAALLLAVAQRRGFVRAHIASAGVWAFYSGCILYSALLTEPPVPVIAGTVAAFVALTHIAIARGDAERGHR